MLKPAFGAISILLTLVIIGIIFIMTIPALKSVSGSGIGASSIKQESAEEKANEMIKDIERMRKESIDYYNNQN